MMESPKLIEISSDIHSKLKSNDSIEIDYIKIEKKQTLRIYVEESNYCITNSAAYALGFLNVEEFDNSKDDYYYITEETMNNLKENFNIEFYGLNLEKNSTNRKL